MSRTGIVPRANAVERALRHAAVQREARRLAACLGISQEELRAEIKEIDRICRAVGAVTAAERLAAVARDLGMPADELRREVEHLRAEAGGAAD